MNLDNTCFGGNCKLKALYVDMYTHSVAVGAYIIYQERMLLLNRNTPPYVWAPPGGRLLKDEDPVQGLMREVYEECALVIEVICPIATWYGKHGGVLLIAIFFLCDLQEGTLTLSHEHLSGYWFTLDEVRKLFRRNQTFGILVDYERAFLIHDHLTQFNL